MARSTSSLLKGDDYQHLISWLHVLDLQRSSQQVASVTVEDTLAKFVDDVTVQRTEGSKHPHRYFQIKYHVTHNQTYSVGTLTEKRGTGRVKRSLLDRLWESWKYLRDKHKSDVIELVLLSNWHLDTQLAGFVDGETNHLRVGFYSAGKSKSAVAAATIRSQLASALGVADDSEFKEFLKSIRLDVGSDCSRVMKERAQERMESLGLKHDDATLLTAIGQVREWIKNGPQVITSESLTDVIENLELAAPSGSESGTVVYFHTVINTPFEVGPDYILDWRQHFQGSNTKERTPIDPAIWNTTLSADLAEMKHRLQAETSNKLLRVRGSARLAPWVGFGFTFSRVAGYILELEQNGAIWRSDATPERLGTVTSQQKDIHSSGAAVAVVICVSGSAESEADSDVSANRKDVKKVLFIQAPNVGQSAVESGGHAVDLVDQIRQLSFAFIKEHKATKLYLYLATPAGLACLLGHRIGAICSEVQVMEYGNPGYFEAFTLHP